MGGKGMIKKLRLKFVAVCMAMVTAILSMVLFSVYTAVERNVEELSRQVLRRVIEDSGLGRAPKEYGLEFGGDRVFLPYFTVSVLRGGGSDTAYVTGGTYDNLENTDALSAILLDCLNQQLPEGVVKSYGLRYLRRDNGPYVKLAFVDMTLEQAMLQDMMRSYLFIAVLAFLLLLGVSVLLAWWTTRPVERAWKQQRQFLSDASHELKTPLTVILSNAELLEATPMDERPSRWTDNILSEARQMKNLVEEMLTLARADNMTHTVTLSEVSLSDVAEDCALAFDPVAFEAGKRLAEALSENVMVFGDRDRLRQLVSILLDNAIKYGAPGGTITLSLQNSDRQAKLTVSNPGPPIPPEQLRRLFQRFYRADASRGEQSGFGLGLSIAAVIALEHRGSLRAESDHVSTRFIFTLPLRK